MASTCFGRDFILARKNPPCLYILQSFFSQLKIFDYYFKVIFRITIQYDKREFKSPGRRLAEDKIE